MLGNDVVDLADAGGRHPRFDARVFTTAERALIAADPRLRGVLWAAKESAYKAARKEDARTVFSPSRFLVRLEDARHATVAAGERRFAVELSPGDGYVHAVARGAGDPPATVCTAVETRAAGADESDAVRRLTVDTIERVTGIAGFAVVRDSRIPSLRVNGHAVAADLSLSHHGRFVAFACVLR
jgi:phosphopantetheinyl transferase (holo-ACP synthase)